MAALPAPGIVKWGAVSSLGCTAAQTGFFLRAGNNHTRLTPFIDEWGERIQMSYVSSLPPTMTGVERMIPLAAEALSPLSELLGRRGRIAVALPERFAAGSLPNELNEQGRLFASRFSRELLGLLDDVQIEYFPSGRAGGALALARAVEWLERGETNFAVAGGVDTFYDWPVLAQLQKQDRLLTEDNLDGFLPGEAAAFVGLSRQTAVPPVRIAGLGTGMEPAPILSEQASRAHGVTQAMNAAMQPLRAAGLRSRYWVTDLTHETYGIKEFQTVITRFGDVMGANTRLETPLREIGNIGAATLPMFTVMACEAWLRRYAADRFCVALAGSDSGLRGALLLEGTEG